MLNTAQKSDEHIRSERLKVCVTADQKALVQHAAELEGCSLPDYVTASVQNAARRTMEAHNIIALSAADSLAFVDALLNPPPIDARLQDSVRRYRSIKASTNELAKVSSCAAPSDDLHVPEK